MKASLLLVGVCAIGFIITGCAQFKDVDEAHTNLSGTGYSSFSQYDGAVYNSDGQYWTRPNDSSNQQSNRHAEDKAGCCGYGYEY
jgi:hypothetical protein